MGPFNVCKMMEIDHQSKKLITSLISILMFSKKLDKFYSDLKIDLKKNQIKLMLELFMCLRLKLLILFLKMIH
jgi:hypothetical protein